MDVTVIWAAIIALGLFMYVVLDGFDLGIASSSRSSRTRRNAT